MKEPYAKPVIGKVTGPAPLRGGAERRDDRREVLTGGQRDIHGRGATLIVQESVDVAPGQGLGHPRVEVRRPAGCRASGRAS